MPSDAEIIKATVDDFQKNQTHMKNAKDENAHKTYEGLKKDYRSFKSRVDFLRRQPNRY